MENSVLKKRTILVLLVTIFTMVAEIYFGIITNSMALTADGFHMGTHAFAFLITLVVCIVAVAYRDKEYLINAWGGFLSAIFLGMTSLGIITESVMRYFHPMTISFAEAILVASLGLAVNMLCIFVMGGHEHAHHDCHNEKEHNHAENLNFKAAYLHILADALTSVLAIGALLCGQYFGYIKLDPIIGVVGGIIIAKWSIDLICSSVKVIFAK